ncbi:MAG: BMP family ABC transporter substrate-binding protein [bacterium]|nr:BMP family ABC transporter substrate-binding protein [bacterium]
MRRNPRLLLILLLVLALVLAACGGGGGDDATNTPQDEEPTATATEESAAGGDEATATATEEADTEETEEAGAATEEGEEAEATEEDAEADATEEGMAGMEVTTEADATEEGEEAEATEEGVVADATEEGEEGTIVDTAVESDFTTLVAAVEAAGLTETLSEGGPFTVFAPTDEAFEAALEALGLTAEELLADTETLTNILTYHVVEGEVLAADLEDGQTVTTLQGGEITVAIAEDGTVTLNDTATVVLADVAASNGVIHAIDAVLLPPDLAGADATEEATEEAAVEAEPTAVAAVTEEATEEAVEAAEVTEEPTEVAAETEATEEPTEVADEAEATEEATEEAVVEAEATEEGAEADATEEAAAGTITSACLVTDSGGVTDGTFNQLAFDGMVQAGEEFGLETQVIESSSPSDFEPNINTCLDGDYDVVITVGFLLADATLAAAEANPDVYFIGVDQFVAEGPENLVGIQFREDQAGFLVGAMAALVSESGTIAGVYGIDIPPVIKFRNGFEQGARYINPDIETLGVYIDSFEAPDRGADAAEQFIGEGADVIFGAGGPTGSGGITFAAQEGVRVIGVDQDEYFTTFGGGESPGAENLITSAVKRIDVGVYNLLSALAGSDEFEFEGGTNYILDAANNGIGFAPAHDAEVPEEVVAQVNEIFELLASGELETGVDPASGALLDAEGGDAEPTEEATEAPNATSPVTPTPGS